MTADVSQIEYWTICSRGNVTQPLPNVVVAASRLRAAIDETAAALAGADLDRLLASDALLQKVLSEIPLSATLPVDERPLLRAEIDEAQAALRRCRRLGAAVSDFVRFSLEAQGQGLGYEPARAVTAALAGRGFSERA
jgi:hypothetical protein